MPRHDPSWSDKDYKRKRKPSGVKWGKDAAILTLSIALAILTYAHLQHMPCSQTSVSEFTGIDSSTERWVQYHWHTGYSTGANVADVDAVWNAILPSHGIVALDREWASERQLPASMKLPGDHSKGVYILDAYHQLHCLVIVRKSLHELLRGGRLLTYPPSHSEHCFDALRQYVMCTAGDTPLYTWGRNETGDKQLRKCRDWNALSQWAADNSACYLDTEYPVPLGDHFGHCEQQGDGLSTSQWFSRSSD